jgi:hypothetical protein
MVLRVNRRLTPQKAQQYGHSPGTKLIEIGEYSSTSGFKMSILSRLQPKPEVESEEAKNALCAANMALMGRVSHFLENYKTATLQLSSFEQPLVLNR